jgi:hypothetical protein
MIPHAKIGKEWLMKQNKAFLIELKDQMVQENRHLAPVFDHLY